MGWKQVKQHYRIQHLVCVTEDGICIGSGYVPDIMVISPEGELVKLYDGRSNDDLVRYQAEMTADPVKLKELVLAVDTFDKAVRVYTYDGARIIEKLCEEPGWPNVTHDGELMYDNTFSTDRAYIVRQALANARAGISGYTSLVEDQRRKLAEYEALLATSQADLATLEACYAATDEPKAA